jgi:alanyl-tRNA synthetase
MTDRLYYHDARLRTFTARVLEARDDGRRVYLDRTAFYPTSGGQPHDYGMLGGVPVVDVVDEEDRVAHVLAEALPVAGGDAPVEGTLDWARRFDHMQQHTGQHLLSAVIEELYAIRTLSFHLGQESSTIEIGAATLSATQMGAIERRANEVICENRAVRVVFEDAAQAQGLRKPSERDGILRVVTIEDLDRSACGGTHVEATGMIGALLLRKLDKIRGNVRLEFLCGARATARARKDFDALSEIARGLSAPLDEAPALVAGLSARVQELEKARRKLAMELAVHQGKQLYQATIPGAGGRRYAVQDAAAIDDETRALAQSFTGEPNAVFVALCPAVNAVLVAASRDSGLHAGELVKKSVSAVGGRGGGNAQIAQGSAPAERFAELADLIRAATGCAST